MNLGKNINNLLKRYSEVYVKGLGVFKKKHSAAQFDKQRELFLPPISYVEFDAKSEQGFNFIHYIQQQQHLNLDAATQVLEQAVADLQDQLRQQGQAKLEDLGHIVSYGSSLVFKPLDISGFNFEAIAHVIPTTIETVIPERDVEEMKSFIPEEEEVLEVEKEETPILAEVSPEAELDIVEDPIVAPFLEESKSLVAEPQKEEETLFMEEEEAGKSSSIWYYITAAIIILVAIVIAFLLNPTLKDQLLGTKKPAAVVIADVLKPEPKIDRVENKMTQDSLKQDTARVDSSKVQDVATPLASEVVKESVPIAQPKYQLVISGSHRTLQTAEAEAAALRAKGYTTVRAVEGKFKRNKKKVIWDFYLTKDEADRDQAKVVKSFKGAWVEKLSN